MDKKSAERGERGEVRFMCLRKRVVFGGAEKQTKGSVLGPFQESKLVPLRPASALFVKHTWTFRLCTNGLAKSKIVCIMRNPIGSHLCIFWSKINAELFLCTQTEWCRSNSADANFKSKVVSLRKLYGPIIMPCSSLQA